MSKLYAKEAIGQNLATGRALYLPGDEVPEDHPNINNWKAWGMVSDQAPKTKPGELTELSRPLLVPVFPIHQDISSASTEVQDEDEDAKKTRLEAQTLSSVPDVGGEQARKKAQQNELASAKQKAATNTLSKALDAVKGATQSAAPVRTGERPHAQATTDVTALEADRSESDADVETVEKEEGEPDATSETVTPRKKRPTN